MPSKTKRICKNCGKKLILKKYKSNANGKYNKKYCSKRCFVEHAVGNNGTNWRGGKYEYDGYIYIYKPEHPSSYKNGYVRNCRLVVEKKIKRYLKRNEYIHHINHVRNDDRIENLKILSPSEHYSLHMSKPRPERRIREYYKEKPKEVVIDKHINVGNSYKHMIGRKCCVCGKDYWGRFSNKTNWCSIKCHWIVRK